MTHTHTPGPWDPIGCAIYAGEIKIAEFIGIPWERMLENEANVNLIAAAPDMLKALEFLMEQYDSSGDFTMGGNLTNEPFLKARAAIAKAIEGGEA